MENRLNLTVEIHNVGPKRINVRSNLLAESLLARVQDKFSLDGQYELRLKGRSSLNPKSPLNEVVKEGDTLSCVRVVDVSETVNAIRKGERAPFSRKFRRVYLQEEGTLSEFDLFWQPAIIGRKDQRDPSKNRLLAVDLGDLEELPTVSRHHACITEKDGVFYLEVLQVQNPTFMGDRQLRAGRHQLQPGAQIQLGRLTLQFFLVS